MVSPKAPFISWDHQTLRNIPARRNQVRERLFPQTLKMIGDQNGIESAFASNKRQLVRT